MSAPASTRDPMTMEAFFAFLDERPETERWELIDSQAVLSAGVTRAHSLITGNVAVALHTAARRTGCEAHTSAFFISGGSVSGFLAAADVFVRCGALSNDACMAEDPVIVVEVLSPSTIRHDRVRKFERYTAIQSLRQIVLVYRDEVRVESFLREGEDWPMTLFKTLDGSLALPVLQEVLSLAAIYEGVHG